MNRAQFRVLLSPTTTLTGFHFAVTALVGFVSNSTGYTASMHVLPWELLWFSIVANMSITAMNFSLMLNSVGFYQEHNMVENVYRWACGICRPKISLTRSQPDAIVSGTTPGGILSQWTETNNHLGKSKVQDLVAQLSQKVVQNVHLSGGSLLGVSHGGPNVSEIVDSMGDREINMLFVLGGNGTHAGANAIHNESHSAYRGIGVVKLMGRSSGFIVMHASLASGQIDLCLIPEVPFELNGPHGVLSHLKYLLETKGSVVICVAEGAGQNFVEKTNAKDASGNVVLGDIGVHIQQEMANIHNIPFNIPRANGKSRKTSPTRAVEYL